MSSSTVRWGGLAAMVGGALGIILTPPFAVASAFSYPGGTEDLPSWTRWVIAVFPLDFASGERVYFTYGRLYFLTLLPELWDCMLCADCAAVDPALSKNGASDCSWSACGSRSWGSSPTTGPVRPRILGGVCRDSHLDGELHIAGRRVAEIKGRSPPGGLHHDRGERGNHPGYSLDPPHPQRLLAVLPCCLGRPRLRSLVRKGRNGRGERACEMTEGARKCCRRV